KYQNPVVIMTCANLGQMEEPCSFPEFKTERPTFDWAMDGTGRGIAARQRGEGSIEVVGQHTLDKVNAMIENEQRWETFEVEDAEYVFVAFGLPSRACKDTVKALRAKGEKVGLIRPITIWPFPVKAFAELGSQVKGFISVEGTNVGQMVEDVALATKKVKTNLPCYLLNHGGNLPTVKQITAFYEGVKAGNIKEVF
ncbi:MAG: 3-methyl-2-oxobutanoate dehydrogenase subunit beta, partial [Lachnospiraceae bacterium]|nr:3-methyl-2-oxobutanoate dehydrogenase subunit beta [Lachnospiraceae bacterium]